MSISHELSRSLANQLEKMGIIDHEEMSDFLLNIILWKVREETSSIYDRFATYIQTLPSLGILEKKDEEVSLKELADLFESILNDLASEMTLSKSDERFKTAIQGMQRLLIAFQLGRYQWENPAAEINAAYHAGMAFSEKSSEVDHSSPIDKYE